MGLSRFSLRLALVASAVGVWTLFAVAAPGREPAGDRGTAAPRVRRLTGRGDAVPVVTTAAGKVAGRWLGQDGHDYCGAQDAIKPNGYQDVHLALAGLPPRREIAAAWINGYGSGEWQYKGVQNHYGAVLVRRPRATTADLYFEPDRVETGREFVVRLRFDDGTEVNVDIKGGRAAPDLRTAGTGLEARWIGQDRHDLTGPGPSVGPDGRQDVRIALAKLDPKEKVTSVLLEAASGGRWAFGPNPKGHHNAEFAADEKDPTVASLTFQPDRNLAGAALRVTVTYANGKTDTARLVGSRTDPKLAMPPRSIRPATQLNLTARWLGQDGSTEAGAGGVRVRVSGLPARGVAAAVLSDSVRGVWVHRAVDRVPLDVEDGARPLVFRAAGDRRSADLFLSPTRDESGTMMTLRLVFADGSMAVGSFPGGACDPSLRAQAVDRSEAVARPGDDVEALANRHGTVKLLKGNYPLSRPLVLSRPVTIVGEPGAVLTFSQAADAPPWTAAIKIHAGDTTLRDFAVRFAGPVRWKTDVSWGPAVIGTTDNLDGVPITPKLNLTFSGLDLEGTVKSGAAPWEEAPRLIRLHGASSGRVVNNRLRGGLIHMFEGPWLVEGNTYQGTQPGTYSHAVFVVHEPHDVVVRKNTAKPLGASGKTWRFLIFVQRGDHDRVEDNVIEGVGPRDDDSIPPANAPEIILTESYSLFFEGKPTAVSSDGRLLEIDRVRWMPARAGDVVSVLSGKGAGEWRRIAQRVSPTVYLLESPLPAGAEVVSITPGFVHQVYAGNVIDAPHGGPAAGFVLAGNHFATRVVNNRVTGAGEAFAVMASATENPQPWGWSHAPMLGLVLEGNVIEDSEKGAVFGISHGGLCKSNRGRVYMTMALRENTVCWSDAFLKAATRPAENALRGGITLGYAPSIDPGELVVEMRANHLDAPPRALSAPALKVHAAALNGRSVSDQEFRLAPRPGPHARSGSGRATPAEASR